MKVKEKKRVLLINPNYPTFFQNKKNNVMFYNKPFQPLSLAIIASALEVKGLEVRIIDANLLKLSKEKLKEEISKFKAGIVLVTSSPIDRWQCPIPDYSATVKTIDAVREVLPSSFIILTGAHGTSFPYKVASKCKNADIIVRGEPEATVIELIDRFLKGGYKDVENTLGISYIKNGKLITNKDRDLIRNLDELPIPAYHLLKMDKYYNDFLHKNKNKNFSLIETSRGCPYECVFCYKGMLNPRVRTKSGGRVIKELDLLYNRYNVCAIYFLDLTFTLNLERTEKICESIIEKGYDITWGCTTRVDKVNGKILKLMKKAGCKFITYGAETFDRESLGKSNKQISPEKVAEAVKMTKDAGIEADLNFVIGLPGDNEGKVEKNWKIYTSLDPYSIGASVALPYPNTELYNSAKKEGMIKDEDWMKISDFSGLVGTNYTYEKLKKITKKHTTRARLWYLKREYGRFFYLNPGFIVWFLNLIRRSSFKEMVNIFDFGIRSIKEFI